MESNFNVGQRLRELRVERALSQEHLALSAEITPAYLGLIERGKKNPTVQIIERLCMAMDISLSAFFSYKNSDESAELDDVDILILSYLRALKREEKALIAQNVKNIVHFRNLCVYGKEEL